jgi:hypothetical protein
MKQVLGLDICADIIVGDEMRRGISGGQRKRVTTGGFYCFHFHFERDVHADIPCNIKADARDYWKSIIFSPNSTHVTSNSMCFLISLTVALLIYCSGDVGRTFEGTFHG